MNAAESFSERTLVSVVVCTRNRAEQLRGCLAELRALAHQRAEFLVVDNAASDDSTRDVVSSFAELDPRFRYVQEREPGLSRARNRGLAAATGEIVAFVDDDVRVPPQWISALLEGLRRRSDVACVTGPVISASLERSSERYFDARVSWSSSGPVRLFDGSGPDAGERSPLHPYAAGAFGTGANMAFHTRALRELGGFDEALGAGSPTGGGEDLDVFVRVIRSGYAICAEPGAVVAHHHRADTADLERQMHAYGKGLAAYLAKYLFASATTLDVLRRAPGGLRHLNLLAGRSKRAAEAAALPRALWRAELRGVAAGPFAYARARSRQRPANRIAVAP